ncbi:MAG: hypothetical protein LBV52_04580 [Spirochaetaceae bacterium]|jgi:uncharacterized membrane protein YcgQ (UPF0703/DUF1980 family)|nr:hypothetical protein [Spirochaetaceae bacterium]
MIKLSKSAMSLVAAVFFALVTSIVVFAGHSENKTDLSAIQSTVNQNTAASAANNKIVEIKEKLFVAQVQDVYLNSEDYIGKTIKLEGLFKTEISDETGKEYNYVMRYGPGCCGNDSSCGFEIAWDKTYPQTDEWVEAVGVLDSYEEDDSPYPFLYIKLDTLKVKENRGIEFVTQ